MDKFLSRYFFLHKSLKSRAKTSEQFFLKLGEFQEYCKFQVVVFLNYLIFSVPLILLRHHQYKHDKFRQDVLWQTLDFANFLLMLCHLGIMTSTKSLHLSNSSTALLPCIICMDWVGREFLSASWQRSTMSYFDYSEPLKIKAFQIWVAGCIRSNVWSGLINYCYCAYWGSHLTNCDPRGLFFYIYHLTNWIR